MTGEEWRTRRKTCPSASSYTTNPTRTGLISNPYPRGERPASDSYISISASREVSVVIRTHTSVGLNYEDNKFQINGSSCVSCNTRTYHLNGRHSSFWSSFMIRAFDALRINYNIMNWPHPSQHTVRAGGYGRYRNIRWARILQHARPSRQNSELHIQHGKCNVRSENGWASGKLHIQQLSSIIVVSKVMICRFQLLWSTLFSLT